MEQQKLDRLIKIAKPLDICLSNEAKTDTSKSISNKKQMPLIGKRNQFSKFKIVKTANVQSCKTTSSKALASDEEEMEEDEDNEDNGDHEAVKQNSLPNDNQIDSKQTLLTETNITKSATEESTSKANITNDNKILANNDVEPKHLENEKEPNLSINDEQIKPYSVDITENNKTNESIAQNQNSTEDSDAAASSKNKRRHRQRQRNKRPEVDLEDFEEHETNEKYSKWVPPENQSGDGFTKLNEKYGY